MLKLIIYHLIYIKNIIFIFLLAIFITILLFWNIFSFKNIICIFFERKNTIIFNLSFYQFHNWSKSSLITFSRLNKSKSLSKSWTFIWTFFKSSLSIINLNALKLRLNIAKIKVVLFIMLKKKRGYKIYMVM